MILINHAYGGYKMETNWFETCVGFSDQEGSAVVVEEKGKHLVLCYTDPQFLMRLKSHNPSNAMYVIQADDDIAKAAAEASVSCKELDIAEMLDVSMEVFPNQIKVVMRLMKSGKVFLLK